MWETAESVALTLTDLPSWLKDLDLVILRTCATSDGVSSGGDEG